MDNQQHKGLVKGYLKPCNKSFITKYAEINGISKSQAVNDAVKALKACQPPDTLQRILKS